MKHNNNINHLVNVIQQHAISHSHENAFIFLRDGEQEENKLSFQDLDQQAKSIAALLQQKNLIGERALLLFPPCLDFISAFLGCLYAGVIAVPAYPPRTAQDVLRVQDIIQDSSAKIILTESSLQPLLEKLLCDDLASKKINCLACDIVAQENHYSWQQPNIHDESLAFIQYTSGSTGTPKGVMVSHGNIIHNEAMIADAFGHDDNTVVAGWLPFYHDMGLIGNILQPLYLGRPCILMSPLAFLQKPWRWLEMISKYQATTSGGPNFAYEMCIRKTTPERKKNLDLSSWKLAFNGAEPVRTEVLDRFADAFAECGFQKKALYPCYGMAETTLFMTGGDNQQNPVYHCVDKSELENRKAITAVQQPSKTQSLVGCGHPWFNQKLIIVNPDTFTQCAENEVGEIWVQGASVTQGYWQKPELTQEVFNAYLNDTGEGPFLRTGDLGYFHNGELFINGRLKDLMIVRGRNHYPEDIEFSVQSSHEALRPGCAAAFSIDFDGQEKVVVVQEVKRNFINRVDVSEVLGDIKQTLTVRHGLQVITKLLWPGSIPKTSSGKVRRSICRNKFLAGELKGIDGLKFSYQSARQS